MVNFVSKRPELRGKFVLSFAGGLAALCTVLLVPKVEGGTTQYSTQNPVIVKVLSKAKKHRIKGRLKEAAKLLAAHATADNPEVLLNYAKMLARGWGISRDLDKARDTLLLAVQRNFPKWGEAAFELGRIYRSSKGKDCDRIAFEWFMESARSGHMKAHAELGRHYSRGIGVEVDLGKALEHYKIAARAGSANSLVSFIHKVKRSSGGTFSEEALQEMIEDAIPALENEAVAGRGSSAKVLGRLYRDGLLVERNDALAEMWFERGLRLGDSGSMVELALLLQQKQGIDVPEKRVIALLYKAVEMDNSGALTELGRLHMRSAFGLNREDARTWFERGVAAGHAGSMMELAKLELSGSPDKGQVTKAIEMLKHGASMGHLGCKRLLERLGTAKDVSDPNFITKEQPAKSRIGQPFLIRKMAKRDAQKKNFLSAKSQSRTNSSRPKRTPMTGATTITPFKRGS